MTTRAQGATSGGSVLRYLAVAIAGGTAFLDMYSTQPLLPALRVDFDANESAVAATVSATTFAAAMAAPLIGPVADRIGRKRVISTALFLLAVVTFGAAHAVSLRELVAWRFAQGLVMPGILSVTVAYVAEEFPAEVGGRAIASYIGGNVLGGFLGRYVAALVAARYDWHAAFVVLGALSVAGGAAVLVLLPRAANFTRRASFGESFASIGGFLRMPRMLATYAVGSSILFSLIAAFTYATFYLAGPAFGLGTVAIGNVFFVYLAGVVATPLSGILIDRYGNRRADTVALLCSSAGVALTLAPSLVAVIAGLAVMSTGVFVAQAASQGYVGKIAGAGRGTAVSLYLTFYYVGGGLGALAPGRAWEAGGWPLTCALVIGVQLAAAALAFAIWREPAAAVIAAASPRAVVRDRRRGPTSL